VAYSRVVGYTFLSDVPDNPNFTLLGDAKVNETQLQKLKTAEAILTGSQVSRLMKAASTSTIRTPGAACYEPHHIFVFYDGERAVAAIELCFSCNQLNALPAPPHRWTQNWATLAKLSWDLHLGLGSPDASLDRYLKRLKSRSQ
jgi:hypothetical protein